MKPKKLLSPEELEELLKLAKAEGFERLIGPEALAVMLEVELSWVYRHTAPGCDPPEQRIPSIMLGKKLRFRLSEIKAWQDEQRARAMRQNPDSRGAAAPRTAFRGKSRVNGHAGSAQPTSSGADPELAH